jgi:OOP family OmpA-OmpF porin
MHRLEAVTRVGQGAAHDHAHRVVEVRAPHLLFEADGQGFLGELGHEGVRCGDVGQAAPGQRAWRNGDSKGRPGVAVAQQAAAAQRRLKMGTIRTPYGTMMSSVVSARAGVCPSWDCPIRMSFWTFRRLSAAFLERRIMKKLNKVAVLFARPRSPPRSPFAQARSVDNWRNRRHRLEERHQRTVLARCQLDARPPPAECDGALKPAAARRLRPGAGPAPLRRACRPPAPAPAPVRRRGPAAAPAAPVSEKVTFAADAFFDFDKSVLKPEAKAKLDDLVSKTKGINLEVIIAVGHTDSDGPMPTTRSCRCAAPSRQGLSGEQGRREEPRLHRRQGREAAGGRQQDQGRQGEEPPRRDRGRRHPRQEVMPSGLRAEPAPASGRCPKPRLGGVSRLLAPACDARCLRYDHAMSNVDAQELAKFSALAHRWWDPTASSARCTRSTRCAWTGSTSLARWRGKRSSTSAAAAASWPSRWRARAPT